MKIFGRLNWQQKNYLNITRDYFIADFEAPVIFVFI